jgi:SecD/SecF fusion protein
MSGNILWKFILTALIIWWCIISITPLQDRPFEQYIAEQATAEVDTFNAILDRAQARVANKESKTLFTALRELGVEEEIDYATFFPEIQVKDIANRNKRNNILLKYLLSRAQSQLRLGLDLKGGVGVTMKMDASAQVGMSAYEQAEQLEDAISIMGERLDGSA